MLKSPLTSNIALSIGGQGYRAFIQGLTFFLLSKELGAANYGLFVPIVALCFLLNTFSSLGKHQLMLIQASKMKDQTARLLGNCYCAHLLATPVLLLTASLVCLWLHSDRLEWETLFLVFVSDLILLPVLEINVRAFQANEKMSYVVFIGNVHITVRFIIFVLLLTFNMEPLTLNTWAKIYAFSTFVGASVSVIVCRLQFQLKAHHMRIENIFEGLQLSISTLTLKSLTDGDKVILPAFVSPSIVGNYSVAYRVMELCLIPIRGAMASLYPKLMLSENKPNTDIIKPLLLLYFYAVTASFLLLFISQYLARIFGFDFAAAQTMLQWFSCYPLLFLTRQLLMAYIDAKQLFKQKTLILSMGLGFSLILALALMVSLGWKGAVVAVFAGESLIILLSARMLYMSYSKREKSSA